mgnify:CR=1 FL=1
MVILAMPFSLVRYLIISDREIALFAFARWTTVALSNAGESSLEALLLEVSCSMGISALARLSKESWGSSAARFTGCSGFCEGWGFAWEFFCYSVRHAYTHILFTLKEPVHVSLFIRTTFDTFHPPSCKRNELLLVNQTECCNQGK